MEVLPGEQTDETTPLLAQSAPVLDTKPEDEDKPLPKFQIFLLSYARLVEPIAFFSIFPFINQMIYETGTVAKADVGFWSGAVESLFSLTQTFFMLFWGRAADRFGRKPVLIASLSGVAVASALFGISNSVWQMIALRMFAGVFAGTIVTVRTMFTENSTPKTQARAFSFFAFAGNLGIFLGPLLGGALSKPAEQYPWLFGSVYIFKVYPYLLPCIVSGCVAASAALINLFWLIETRPVTKGSSAKVIEPPPIWEILSAPGVGAVLYIFEYALLLGVAFTAVAPVFFYTPIELGGFNFSPAEISLYLAACGISQAIWLLVLFPPLQLRFGTGNLMRACAVVWPLAFASMPVLNVLLRAGHTITFWVLVPFNVIAASGVSMAFTGVQLALNDISPNHLALGTLNGIALALAAAVRAVAPAASASIYALGVKYRIMHGYLGWLFLVLLAVGFLVSLRWLPAKAEGRVVTKSADDENI